MQSIFDLVTSTNIYLNSRGRTEVNLDVVLATADWITRMLRMFGLGEGPEVDSRGQRVLGWGQAVKEGANGVGDDVSLSSCFSWATADVYLDQREAVLMPYLRALSTFRDAVRKLARDGAQSSEILALCDTLRDQEMVDLGVALDDQDDGKALVKLIPAEQLRAARDEKAAIAQEKADKRAANQAAADAKRREKLEKGRTPPQELFKTGQYAQEYSKWDEAGLPTHDAKGEEITKNALKKLKKMWDQQQVLHNAFLAESS